MMLEQAQEFPASLSCSVEQSATSSMQKIEILGSMCNSHSKPLGKYITLQCYLKTHFLFVSFLLTGLLFNMSLSI